VVWILAYRESSLLYRFTVSLKIYSHSPRERADGQRHEEVGEQKSGRAGYLKEIGLSFGERLGVIPLDLHLLDTLDV
jgi:hypothetical protein